MNRNSEGSFVASWKTLATISICLAIASLATLVTVVAINDVDLLSTVALTLAVIAFVAQLLIYIAQTAATSQQTAQSLAINTETKSLLTDIRARTGGTESVLKEQFSLVLVPRPATLALFGRNS